MISESSHLDLELGQTTTSQSQIRLHGRLRRKGVTIQNIYWLETKGMAQKVVLGVSCTKGDCNKRVYTGGREVEATNR